MNFSYQNGKAYAKGTYLDILYHKDENKICNAEFLYDKLMFRTPLRLMDEKLTTQLLQSYKNSFEQFIIKNSYSIKYENSIYYLTQNNKNKTAVITDFLKTQTFDYNKFVHSIQKYSTQELQIPLLPLAAYFKVKMKKNDFSEILNLAHSYIVEYNNII